MALKNGEFVAFGFDVDRCPAETEKERFSAFAGLAQPYGDNRLVISFFDALQDADHTEFGGLAWHGRPFTSAHLYSSFF